MEKVRRQAVAIGNIILPRRRLPNCVKQFLTPLSNLSAGREMENLFRMMLVRPAVAQDPKNPSIDLTQPSKLQNALRGASTPETFLRMARAASEVFVKTADFIAYAGDTPLARELGILNAALDAIEEKGATPAKVQTSIEKVFGKTAGKLVSEDAFSKLWSRLCDSILAIKVLRDEHERPVEELVRQLRTLAVIARAAEDKDFPVDTAALQSWRRRSVQLPFVGRGASQVSTKESDRKLRDEREKEIESHRRKVNDLAERYRSAKVAMEEVRALPSASFKADVLKDHPGVEPPKGMDLEALVGSQARFAGELRALTVKQLQASPDARAASVAGGSSLTGLAGELFKASDSALTGKVAFKISELSPPALLLTPEAEKGLSDATRTTLKKGGVDLSVTPVDKVSEQLEKSLSDMVSELTDLVGTPVQVSMRRIGNALVSIQTPIHTEMTTLLKGEARPRDHNFGNPPKPVVLGRLAPAGVADLLVIKQQLVGYEAADIAHIENVLKGERKLREHVRREETEITTFIETEITTSEEHELETADRFEMSRETSETIKEDVSLKAGLKISGKYGPITEFAVSAEGSYARSKEEATKNASKFSQDVTERSSKKIAERVLQRSQRRITTETTETNTHEINNVPGTGHVTGIYQWVNKVYQAQMFNYGLRTMFDFMVPEPATFLIDAMNKAHNSSVTLQKPAVFSLTPGEISEQNYKYWVKVTEATDVTPPPEPYKTKSADFKAGGGDDKANYNHAGQITIDEGYQAIHGSVVVLKNVWNTGTASVDVALGARTQRLSGWSWSTNLDNERDSIPFAVDSFKCSQIAVAIEVKCQRTDRAVEKWRLETHAKLLLAYKAQLADYEEKLALLQMQAGVAIQGRNPLTNQRIIETEFKKNCISIITDQHYSAFNAISYPSSGLGEIDVDEAASEGAFVRFFEQAFEWEQMTYVTYPYFWGRKSKWADRIAFEDADPVFEDFLQAGYCRVSVPARPGFEGAIDHYLTFGEIWNGGPLPAISSPLFLPIADEISERLNRPGDEVPQGDPWLVRIPTNLVRLRPDASLPKWSKGPDGEWVEV